jgi:hypothetical protein
MDHVQRAMQVADSAFLALLQIDHGRHGLLLSSLLPVTKVESHRNSVS